MIPVYKPYITCDSLKHVYDALDSKQIIWFGKYKDIVKEKLENYLETENVLLLANGTVACHLMSKCLKIKYPGIKRIIVPNNVYVAAWNGLLFDGEYDLVPIEPDLDTWNMDVSLTQQYLDEETAILAVHNLGNIINIPSLKRNFPNTVIIEDNCEGFSGGHEGTKSGTQSFCSAMSFCGNKTITCGEGGALIVHNKGLYDEMFSYHCQGKTEQVYIHDKLGYNYRMTNVQAAILLGQIELLEEIKYRKHKIFEMYKNNFSQIEEIKLQKDEDFSVNAEWIMAIRIIGNICYEPVKKFYNDRGVDIRPMFYPITFHKHLSYIKCDIEKAEMLSKECFMLPSYPDLSEEEIMKVIDTTKEYIEKINE